MSGRGEEKENEKEEYKNEYVIKEKEFHFTDDQAHSFLTKVKNINIEDLRSCPNIMMLFAESVFTYKPIDYTKCFTEKNEGINYTETKFK
tara:strand:+ start:378 stop:647 length:270 start_codon:yes stop_codon:yes gene_type:complete